MWLNLKNSVGTESEVDIQPRPEVMRHASGSAAPVACAPDQPESNKRGLVSSSISRILISYSRVFTHSVVQLTRVVNGDD